MKETTGASARLKGVRVIAVSALVDLAILLAAAEFLRARLKPFLGFAPRQGLQTVRYAVFGLAVLTVVLIRALKAGQPAGTACDRREASSRKAVRATAMIMALAVVPALLGFLLFVMFGLNIDFYLLLFASACLVFIFFPRRPADDSGTAGG